MLLLTKRSGTMNRTTSRPHAMIHPDRLSSECTKSDQLTITANTRTSVGKLQESNTSAARHAENEIKSFAHLNNLVDDVQLYVLSFLSASEASAMTLVNKQYHYLLHSHESIKLWTDWIQYRWPSLSLQHQNVKLVDLLNLPMALVNDSTKRPNTNRLMSMASSHYPTEIDASHFSSPQVQDYDAFSEQTSFRSLQVDGQTMTQYLGPMGIGARCIRSNDPLPTPTRVAKPKSFTSRIVKRSRGFPWRPFVAPYVSTCNNDDSKMHVNLTPRLVSYYEVTILPTPKDSPLDQASGITTNDDESSIQGCIAIGLATNAFDLHDRMPGWDTKGHSFAYHGDDGGIFHGCGQIDRHFGPCFGQGDTVGCGIDHVKRGIFFTLNGAFLGYGWTNIKKKLLKQVLFPTIGVDSNCPIDCNYGERPFQFNLSSVVEEHKDLVKELCFGGTPARDGSVR